jgi:hypothetical protein
MELAWNTQKNKMSDVKGKEMEQERKGKISNPDIDLERTKLNFDFVNDDRTLYHRVKSRVDDLKKNGSRVQKNSVVMYSNVITVPKDVAEAWGEEKTTKYFRSCYKFFCEEFGKENVVSAKVHFDETAPHMHLHFIPVNKENGKLQARVVMDKAKINYIHDKLPEYLQELGFYVVRGKGKTVQNIENIHEYKKVMDIIDKQKSRLDDMVQELDKTAAGVIQEKRQLKALQEINATLYDALNAVKMDVKETSQEFMKSKVDNFVAKDEITAVANRILNSNKVMFSESLKVNSSLVHQLLDLVKDMYERFKEMYNKQIELFKENRELKKENKTLKTELNQKRGLSRDLDREVQERAKLMITVSEIEKEREIEEKIATYKKENERFAYENEEYRKSVDVLITSYTEHRKQIDFLNRRVDIIIDSIPKEYVNGVINRLNRIEAGQDRSEEREQDYGRSM